MDPLLSFAEKNLYIPPTELPEEMVNSAIAYVENREYEIAPTHKDPNGVRNKTRSSTVSWINWDEWIPGIMYNMVVSANKEFFKYDITHFATRIQSTIYTSEYEDHYTWHVDNSTQSVHDEGKNDNERKLSISLLLSDPDEYEGGELQFHYYKSFFRSIKPKKGSAIIFPSWLPHRVRPVTSGKRISLVGWVHGPMFK